MNRFNVTSKIVSAMVLASTALAGSAAFASSLTPHVPVQAMFGRTHTVNLKLRNDSAESMKVKAGQQELTLAPGKTMPVKLDVGEQIIVAEATATRPAGTVLATISSNLSDATLAFK